jgi:hypothetical protein
MSHTRWSVFFSTFLDMPFSTDVDPGRTGEAVLVDATLHLSFQRRWEKVKVCSLFATPKVRSAWLMISFFEQVQG